MIVKRPTRSTRFAAFPKRSALAAGLALAMTAGSAVAFEIDTGNPDVVLRWATTLRYNRGMRTEDQDASILANPNFDDGDRNFEDGSLVANRLDVLSEMDVVVDGRWGARVSATAWYDHAYESLDNQFAATANTLDDAGRPAPGDLSPYTSRYANGVSVELHDAFAFERADLGNVPVTLRAGRHTVYWGESLLGGGAVHGISYGQYSLDLWKALSTPGIEAKELFRPRESVTLQAQPTDTLSISAQAFFDWESARFPESGSYLTANDALLYGGESLVVGPNQRMLRGAINEPDNQGDWGLMARWSPAWLNGTTGLYVRRTADIQPQLAVVPAVAAVPAATCSALGFQPLAPTTCYINPAAASIPQILSGKVGQYQLFYGEDIDVFGWSLSKSVAGVSVGVELSYRDNMPLQSIPVTALPSRLVNRNAGQISLGELAGDLPGARGETMHGVISLIGLVSQTPLWDSATWQAELVWNHWMDVTDNPNAFKGSDAYRANPLNIDAVDKNFYGLGINFTPTWFQVWPSVDLSMPLSLSGGLSGNSAVVSGGNEDAGQFAIGLNADWKSRYNFGLRYVGFFGDYSKNAAGAMAVPNGTNAVLSDRGHVLFTFKTTF